MEYICSIHNPTFKAWIKLTQSRQVRDHTHQALIDGIHLILAAQQHHFPIHRFIISESFQKSSSFQELLAQGTAPVTCLSDKLFTMLSTLVTPTGVMALIDIPNSVPIEGKGLVVALEGVQDPGNVGTILRTAVACGVTQVWLDTKCADIWSPKVLRAGMGAHFAIDCVWGINLLDALSNFQGKVFATMLEEGSKGLYHTDLRGDAALVFGNEGLGISQAVCQKAESKIAIPMQAGIESLNVGTAVAVCLYERYRQQYYSTKTT